MICHHSASIWSISLLAGHPLISSTVRSDSRCARQKNAKKQQEVSDIIGNSSHYDGCAATLLWCWQYYTTYITLWPLNSLDVAIPLLWHHMYNMGFSNRRQIDWLFNSFLDLPTTKYQSSKLWALYLGIHRLIFGFLSQRAINQEKDSFHEFFKFVFIIIGVSLFALFHLMSITPFGRIVSQSEGSSMNPASVFTI